MKAEALEQLLAIIDTELEAKNKLREEALKRSRTLIRQCASTIRAIHRQEWAAAQEELNRTRASAQGLRDLLIDHPDLYYAGYTQDALKEYVEAFLTYALVRDEELPSPAMLEVPADTYINGLAEASTELRRYILDILRHGHDQEAERMLETMDSVYSLLVTIDYPDAITGGLRRRTDTVRGVLERTRGDLTLSLRQQRLEKALAKFEEQQFGEADQDPVG